jgi:hypothetical protein
MKDFGRALPGYAKLAVLSIFIESCVDLIRQKLKS